MRSTVFLGLATLVCIVSCKDYRVENSPRQIQLYLKDKRGLGDQSLNFLSHRSSSYLAPIHSDPSSSYALGGSSGNFHSGLFNSAGSAGHGIGYSLTPSGGFGSGYTSPTLGHGSQNLQVPYLNGHSSQTYSAYSVPNFGSVGGGNHGLFTPSKNGPVTFGLHGGGGGGASASTSGTYSAPIYSSGAQGLSAYNSGGSGIKFPVTLESSSSPSYGGLSSSGFGNSASSNPVMGGLIIATGSHGSSGYNLPTSGSYHSVSAINNSPGASSSYSIPISSGSHGITLSSNTGSSTYSTPVSSGSYSSSNSQAGLSSTSSDGNHYELPASSGSYSSLGADSYTNYSPHSSSYTPGGSSGYSKPIASYTVPSSNYAGSSSAGYSGSGSNYSFLGPNYASSSTAPGATHTGAFNYTPTYSSSSNPYETSGHPYESHGAYSSINPRYLGYKQKKSHDTSDSESAKYDTISYSRPTGKY